MARRRIREFDAKQIISQHLGPINGKTLSFQGALVENLEELNDLPRKYPSLVTMRLVAKPDQLFGKRNKYNLVRLNVTFDEAKKFIEEHYDKEMVIEGIRGKLTTFLIEPYVPHTHEYYLAFRSERNHDTVFFSATGGVDIEKEWDKVISFEIPTLRKLQPLALKALPTNFPNKDLILSFMESLFALYQKADFTYLELNPFTIDNQETIHLLDTVAEVDDRAEFKNGKIWGELLFPKEFGKKSFPQEEYIEDLDNKSGASLKLTLLNPQGRIWNILSGGGASIIYLDAIANFKKADEIANYGEYSGNPTTQEAYEYAKTILGLVCKEAHPQGKVIFIAGGIANFTDIRATFTGVIRALEEFQEELRKGKVKIYVRRGGPHYKEGLKLMEDLGKRCNLAIEVFGPQTHLTQIVPKALEQIS